MKSSSKKVTIACVIISVLIIFVVFFCMTISLKKTNSQNNSESTYQYTGTTISSDETQILVTTNYQSKIDYTIDTYISTNDSIEETVDYPQNSNGETYGSALDASSFNNNIPDLISVKGKNGIRGYVQKDYFLHINQNDYEHYKEIITDEKMLKWLRSQYKNVRSDYENLSFYDDVYDVPVYDVEHETIIDTFPLTAGTYILED